MKCKFKVFLDSILAIKKKHYVGKVLIQTKYRD